MIGQAIRYSFGNSPLWVLIATLFETRMEQDVQALLLDIAAKLLFAAACVLAARWPEQRLVQRPAAVREVAYA